MHGEHFTHFTCHDIWKLRLCSHWKSCLQWDWKPHSVVTFCYCIPLLLPTPFTMLLRSRSNPMRVNWAALQVLAYKRLFLSFYCLAFGITTGCCSLHHCCQVWRPAHTKERRNAANLHIIARICLRGKFRARDSAISRMTDRHNTRAPNVHVFPTARATEPEEPFQWMDARQAIGVYYWALFVIFVFNYHQYKYNKFY